MSAAPERPIPGGTLAPLAPVALPMVAGLLVEPLGWALIAGAAPLHAGWYGWPALLVGAHMVAFGGLLWPVVGAGWQLVPVVTAMPPRAAAVRGMGWISPAIVLGGPLLWAGMWGWTRVGAAGAALVIGGALARSIWVIAPLARARGRIGVRLWLLAAEMALWAGMWRAAQLYAGRAGAPTLPNPIDGIGEHARLLLGGWIGGWAMGLGALLLPMFAVGREPPTRWLALAGAAWGLGALIGQGWLMAAGMFGAAILLLSAMQSKIPKPKDPGLLAAAAALIAGAALWAGAAAGLISGMAQVAAGAALLLLFQRGIASRIFPFLLWAHLLAGSSARTVPAPPRLVAAQAIATLIGAMALSGGIASQIEPIARLGAAVMGLGALLHLLSVASAAQGAILAWRRAAALPGTAA